MFVEIALGFHLLVLIHFAGNAFLRTYQLLVSPSVLNYKIHDMFYNFIPRKTSTDDSYIGRIQRAIYILNIKEWNFDQALRKYLWTPFKSTGKFFSVFGNNSGILTVSVILGGSLVLLFFRESLPMGSGNYMSPLLAAFSFILVLKGFVIRGNAAKAWTLVFISQLFNAVAILWNVEIEHHQLVLYLGGGLIAAISGYLVLRYIRNREGDISLGMYHGHSYEYPITSLIFLLSCLAMSGFPITPSFIGTDIMFTHIRADQFLLIGFMGLSYLFAELTLIRIYVRIFLGQHRKEYHPIAFKSS
jgi:drug/metabolite transporter superfamily protein YnfA